MVLAGVKKWGDKAWEAIRDELRMFVKENVFIEVKQPMETQRL